MYPLKQETGSVGKVQIEQRAAQSAYAQQQVQHAQMQQMQHMQQIQQMQAQMAEVAAELNALRQPKMKTYTSAQVQILISCETINHIMEEFELSSQKKARLCMARDYLLSMGDLAEFINQPQQQPQQNLEQDPEQYEMDEPVNSEVSLYEDYEQSPLQPQIQTQPQPQMQVQAQSPIEGEQYSGQQDTSITSELEKINQKMAELKKEDGKIEKDKARTGLEKIKDFLVKKATPATEEVKPVIDHNSIPEGMG